MKKRAFLIGVLILAIAVIIFGSVISFSGCTTDSNRPTPSPSPTAACDPACQEDEKCDDGICRPVCTSNTDCQGILGLEDAVCSGSVCYATAP